MLCMKFSDCEMSSVSSQPQFRYTQPPSKVLHLRNLPWECTEEELIELGKPFGKVVNTKCNVGAKETKLLLSSQEIVNNKTTADVAGNVLLVTIEGNDARLVSIDVLHLVFSAFGFVHKITTFEKTAGFQALVQFSDSETASAAKDALDGRSIPSYLIPELGPCSLRITYSAHTDLSVKFQSHRSRYTESDLIKLHNSRNGRNHDTVFLCWKKLEPESNVLLASIENMQYAVTLDVLHTVFSAFGPVLKIAMFDKNGGLQALIQYPVLLQMSQLRLLPRKPWKDIAYMTEDTASCTSHILDTLISIKVNNDRSRDYTIPSIPAISAQPSILGQQPYPMGGPGAHAYNGTQYAPVPDPRGVPPPSAGWNSAVHSIPQSMPMQMHNYPYGPPTGGPAMGHGLMATHGQNGVPHSSPMPPYHPQ
ncbi:UNVERIFIED_CONTAM: Polypyrimidine tract-binding protein2 [Sesamum angustifolium]|uniref:Polypyrimidine tract-binding protein2 n=1 Tax=Sesamum angustifolium TaxID=2727405 RepID=A0AAW2LHD5_9LAMI